MRFLFSLLLVIQTAITASADINKLFIVNQGEEFPETPVHGKVPFNKWLGDDHLSFAKGHTYHLWIDYSSQLPASGTIVTTSKFVLIRDCKRKLNGYEFNLIVLPNAKRNLLFSVGLGNGKGRMSQAIPCRIVEIGRLDALVLQDTTNTTFAGLYSRTTYYTFHYTHATGPRVWSFYGKNLRFARFDYPADSGKVHGLQFYTDLAVQTDTSFDIVFTVSDEVCKEKGSMRDDILTRIYDSASDRRFEWITYRYAFPSEMEKSTDPEGVEADPAFELTPGNKKALCSTCRGYHRFLATYFKVD
jgi:hypothetical protein